MNKIRDNIIDIRARTRTRVIFMVKADAYGHGLCEVARATENIVDAFGVATLEEGMKLRESGITKPILLLICAEREMGCAIKNNLIVCISNAGQINALEKCIKHSSACNIKTHISLNTGMNRLGFGFDELDATLARLASLGVNVSGAYSHLRVRSKKQILLFDRMCEKVREYYPNAIAHLASSHSLDVKKLRYDAVRAGISAYAGAMSVESEVVAVRKVKKGEYVSYGNYKTKRDTNTAVIFGGYADGAVREKPSNVYIDGRECKALGRVCMDMTVVDCGDFMPSIGDKVLLVDGDIIDKISKQRGSIPYTLMTCWRGRAERIYNDESGSKAIGEKSDCENERRE